MKSAHSSELEDAEVVADVVPELFADVVLSAAVVTDVAAAVVAVVSVAVVVVEAVVVEGVVDEVVVVEGVVESVVSEDVAKVGNTKGGRVGIEIVGNDGKGGIVGRVKPGIVGNGGNGGNRVNWGETAKANPTMSSTTNDAST